MARGAAISCWSATAQATIDTSDRVLSGSLYSERGMSSNDWDRESIGTCLGPSIEGKVSKPVKTEMGEMDLQEMLRANKIQHCRGAWVA